MKRSLRIDEATYERKITEPDNIQRIFEAFDVKSNPTRARVLQRYGNPLELTFDQMNTLCDAINEDILTFVRIVHDPAPEESRRPRVI